MRLESKRFVPEDRGRLVNAFLVSFFDRYVQPGFTADLEDKLDSVASGDLAWKAVLREFWDPFRLRVDEVKEQRVAEVIDALNEALAPKLFPERADGGDPRVCPLCGTGNLSLKLGRYGAFVGCSNYPECRYTRKLDESADEAARGQRPSARRRPRERRGGVAQVGPLRPLRPARHRRRRQALLPAARHRRRRRSTSTRRCSSWRCPARSASTRTPASR